MKNESQIPQAQALALERFALITQIQDLLRQGFPLSVALEQASFRPLRLPDGTQRLCARRTLEDWWSAYQHGGFAALTPKVRADKGRPRTLSAQQQKWILEQAQAHLAVPGKERKKGKGSVLDFDNSSLRMWTIRSFTTKTASSSRTALVCWTGC